MVNQKFFLQNRWKIEDNKLLYFGMQNKINLFNNEIKLSKKELDIFSKLPTTLNEKEQKIIRKYLNKTIVLENDLKKVPTSYEDARFCKICVANDFMIPGLEFDEKGKCPMCQTKDIQKDLKSLNPLYKTLPRSKASEYDVALFYTGGKDSTYLLYYLAKVLNLRVLALTWEIPFLSTSAKKTIENTKNKFPETTFIISKPSLEEEQRFYKKFYELNNNLCACPSLAYVMFYPLLVEKRVPYLVVGNEPVQMMGLYYNKLAPKIAYKLPSSLFLKTILNIGRILTLKPPYKNGQFQMLASVKQLAYGDAWYKKKSKYNNSIIDNVVSSLKEVPSLIEPLKKAIKNSIKTNNIPAFVQIDFDKINGDTYYWSRVQELLKQEAGYVEEDGKRLHTSCDLEKCKDYTQHLAFYNMKSRIIPFSALEISLASNNKNLSKEEAIKEIKSKLGFSLDENNSCYLINKYFEGGNINE